MFKQEIAISVIQSCFLGSWDYKKLVGYLAWHTYMVPNAQARSSWLAFPTKHFMVLDHQIPFNYGFMWLKKREMEDFEAIQFSNDRSDD